MKEEKVMFARIWKDRKYLRTRLRIIAAVAVFICVAIFIPNMRMLSLKANYEYASVSEMAAGREGHNLLIDNGKKTVLLVDENKNLLKMIEGGSKNTPFYYACHVAEGRDGSIYIADVIYGDRGNLLDKERITKIKGLSKKVVYEKDYTEEAFEDTPLQNGRILEMREYDGFLYYVLEESGSARVCRIDETTDESETVRVFPTSSKLQDASYDISTDTLAVSYRVGEIALIMPDGSSKTASLVGEQMPLDICAENGKVFYTDVVNQTICGFDESDPETIDTLIESEYPLFKLDYSSRRGELLTTDYTGYLALDMSEGILKGEPEYFAGVRVSFVWREILAWNSLVIGSAALLYLLVVFLSFYIKYIMRNEQAMRVTLIILACITVAFMISYTLVRRNLEINTTSSADKTDLFSKILMEELDENSLEAITGSSDYRNDAYSRLKNDLDKCAWESYEKGDYYYYIIYVLDGENISGVMDFEDTTPCYYPAFAYGDEPYTQVLDTGETISYSENSAYGAWTFVLTPIRHSNGEIFGVLEVGQNLDYLNREQAAMIRNLIISVAVCTVVVVMLLLEIVFFLKYLEKRRNTPKEELDPTDTIPFRTLMFLSYLVDSMQDPFILLLCKNLYNGGLPVSDSVAVTIPISAQLLMMAVVSAFIGRFIQKFGSRKLLTGGMLVQLTGFVVCFATGNFYGILLGKMLIGAGMGIIYVSCNAAASMGQTASKDGEAFAAVAAGTLSGLTIGSGLSSMVLEMGGWRLSYIVGAVILGFGVIMAITSGDLYPGKKEEDISATKDISLIKFLFNRRVLPFFICLLLPFMMGLAFRECFFPLIAEENGFDEVRISQLYLACGVLSLYIGPVLSSWLLKKIGSFWSVVLASVGLGTCMILYVIRPSLGVVIAGLVIIALMVSFAYTCQYSYFEYIPECTSYGEGNAMSIYSVFESTGQTVGPIAYGALLGLGYRRGILIAGVVLLVLLIPFTLFGRKTAGIFKQ